MWKAAELTPMRPLDITSSMDGSTTRNAPITQVMLTLQFQPFLGALNIVQLADVRNLFAEGYPIFSQILRAGPMTGKLSELPIGAESRMPRLQLIKSDLSGGIAFQEDRISLSWDRTALLEHDDGYPGFDAVLDEFLEAVRRVREHFVGIGIGIISPRVGEIIYTDRVITGRADGQQSNLGDVLSAFTPNFAGDAVIYNASWKTPFAIEAFEGYINVEVKGPDLAPFDLVTANLQTMGSFDLVGCDWNDLRSPFLSVRGLIGDVYQKLVIHREVATSER